MSYKRSLLPDYERLVSWNIWSDSTDFREWRSTRGACSANFKQLLLGKVWNGHPEAILESNGVFESHSHHLVGKDLTRTLRRNFGQVILTDGLLYR